MQSWATDWGSSSITCLLEFCVSRWGNPWASSSCRPCEPLVIETHRPHGRIIESESVCVRARQFLCASIPEMWFRAMFYSLYSKSAVVTIIDIFPSFNRRKNQESIQLKFNNQCNRCVPDMTIRAKAMNPTGTIPNHIKPKDQCKKLLSETHGLPLLPPATHLVIRTLLFTAFCSVHENKWAFFRQTEP